MAEKFHFISYWPISVELGLSQNQNPAAPGSFVFQQRKKKSWNILMKIHTKRTLPEYIVWLFIGLQITQPTAEFWQIAFGIYNEPGRKCLPTMSHSVNLHRGFLDKLSAFLKSLTNVSSLIKTLKKCKIDIPPSKLIIPDKNLISFITNVQWLRTIIHPFKG